jgi:leucyl-tRNA synthetase
MSKSRGNVITPDEIVESHGADALRIYEMFMAPFDQDIAWSQVGIVGARRFLNRVWWLVAETYAGGEGAGGVNAGDVNAVSEDLELLRLTHKTIRRVEERIETFRFNTMVSFLMEFVNFLADRQQAGEWRSATFHQALDTLMLLLAPSAPYIADELWSRTGHDGSIHQQAWPRWEAELVQDELIQLAIQVDGRLRDLLELEIDAAEEDVRQAAMNKERVRQALAGRRLDRIVYIPGKILNIVTKKAVEETESR